MDHQTPETTRGLGRSTLRARTAVLWAQIALAASALVVTDTSAIANAQALPARAATIGSASQVDSGHPFFTMSNNWSGYLLPSTHGVFRLVGGSWRVPRLDCGAPTDAESSAWVGIGGVRWRDGASSGTLLQTGTNSNCEAGIQVNDGWAEEVPSRPNRQIVFSNFPISAGDTIDAQVYKSASGIWCTRVTDMTSGRFGLLQVGSNWSIFSSRGVAIGPEQGSAAGLSYRGGYSAEWIVEDPTDSGSKRIEPLADFKNVTFRDLTTDLAHWSLPLSDGVEMVQHGRLVSFPTAVANGQFTIRCSLVRPNNSAEPSDSDDTQHR